MSFNQFTPADDQTTFQQYESNPYMNVTAAQFAYLMQYVEAARGTPRAPKTLPRVPTAEQTNALIDQVPGLERVQLARDRCIFELLYGCGLRISELVSLDLADFDRSERWIRVRGKGRKERQVPFAGKAASALESYLAAREPAAKEETALFLNHRGGRLTACRFR